MEVGVKGKIGSTLFVQWVVRPSYGGKLAPAGNLGDFARAVAVTVGGGTRLWVEKGDTVFVQCQSVVGQGHGWKSVSVGKSGGVLFAQ